MKRFLLLGFALLSFSVLHSDELIYRIGKGTLEESPQGMILRLQGKPYERGVQHGTLLKATTMDCKSIVCDLAWNA